MLIRTAARTTATALALLLAATACGDEVTDASPAREVAAAAVAPDDPAVVALREALAGTAMEPLTGELVAAALPSIRLTPDADLDVSKVGASRVGGRPDLPSGTEWPRSEFAPLTLVAQIDLAEAEAALPGNGLPESGLLSFFVDHESDFNGFWPDTPDMWRVIHSPEGSDLETLPWPAEYDPHAHFEPVGLRFDAQVTFPSPFSNAYTEIVGDVEDTEDAYWNAVMREGDGYRSQLGGHHEPVQDDVTNELATASAEAGRAQSAPADWRTILQLAPVPENGMEFDDGSVLYYGLTETDFAKQRWDQTWFVKHTH